MTIHLLHRPGRHRPRPWRHLTVGALIASIAPSLRVIAGRARHAASERPAFGADGPWADTLHDLNAEVMRDGWNRAMLIPTEPIPVIDYHAVVDGVLVPQVTDLTATDIAFLAGGAR